MAKLYQTISFSFSRLSTNHRKRHESRIEHLQNLASIIVGETNVMISLNYKQCAILITNDKLQIYIFSAYLLSNTDTKLLR